MRCPNCGCESAEVKDSRPAYDGYSVRRRRICTLCGYRFTTYEVQLELRTRQVPVVKIPNHVEPDDESEEIKEIKKLAKLLAEKED